MRMFAKATRTFTALALATCGIYSIPANGQKPSSQSVEEVLYRADIVSGNVVKAITEHILHGSDFRSTKQLPEERRPDPVVLVKRDGSFYFDLTTGQHARNLMETLRQGIHQLQSVEKPLGMDSIALAGAREYWPKVRDISCRESPGIRYYNLDGFEEFCQDH